MTSSGIGRAGPRHAVRASATLVAASRTALPESAVAPSYVAARAICPSRSSTVLENQRPRNAKVRRGGGPVTPAEAEESRSGKLDLLEHRPYVSPTAFRAVRPHQSLFG